MRSSLICAGWILAPSEDYGRRHRRSRRRAVVLAGCCEQTPSPMSWAAAPGDFYRPAHQKSTTPSWTCTGAGSRPMR